MNESAAPKKQRERKKAKAEKKTRNRLPNQIEKQTCKAVSGDTIVSTRTIFSRWLRPRRRLFFFCSLPCRFPFARSLRVRVCVHIKWLQAFSICRWIRPTCQVKRWDFYFSLFFVVVVVAFNLMQWHWLTPPGSRTQMDESAQRQCEHPRSVHRFAECNCQ